MFENACVLYIANINQRTFEIVQNSRSPDLAIYVIISTSYVEYEPQDSHVRGTRADDVYDNGVVEISLLHVCTGETLI